ncbi:MAG: hypothetical protein AAGA85_11120 [Bacteroidota bacterium]
MKIGNVLLILLLFVIAHGLRAQNIERILETHYAAHTQDFWDQVRTVTVEGAWFKGNERTTYTLHAKRPNKILLKGMWQGEPYTEAFDGQVAWTVAPWTKVGKPQLMLTHEQEMITHLFDYGSAIPRDAVLEYKGKVKEEGIYMYWLTELREEVQYDYFVDVEKHYLRKVNRRETLGDEIELLTKTYDIFKQFGGVTFPTVIWIKTEEAEREFVFDDLVVGDGISNDIFKQPTQ